MSRSPEQLVPGWYIWYDRGPQGAAINHVGRYLGTVLTPITIALLTNEVPGEAWDAVDFSYFGPGQNPEIPEVAIVLCPSPAPRGLPCVRAVDPKKLMLLSRHHSRVAIS